jgi:type I restriction enzyme R subunit
MNGNTEQTMIKYNTVIDKYISPDKSGESDYQSEKQLEDNFIAELQNQGYQYLAINNEEDFKKNLRTQIETLNNCKFTDNEWNRFFETEIANKNKNAEEKTSLIQDEKCCVSFKFDDNDISKNIYLINKVNINANNLQVIHQYINDGGKRTNRYDVTVLVNGLPLVHIELKKRGEAIKEAFDQIDRYQNDSFWAESGLFEYIQIFVISNGTNTKYYSNTVRDDAIKKVPNSFEFTNWWSDKENCLIKDLTDFTKTFFAKHTILNILTKYCVFTSDKKLLVMRPYQIAATESILNKIEDSTNNGKIGTIDAGGYIWHATGSGKTLTSFKTAQLVSRFEYIDKVLFVVDRKDLDYQTINEYKKYEEEAVLTTENTNILIKRLEQQSKDSKIIVTTIQKLNKLNERDINNDIFNKRIVIIFDECHRSQFGKMHLEIKKAFKNYYLFGFTGTPILNSNSNTTKNVFGEMLHTYTIKDAIEHENVLPFNVEFNDVVGYKNNVEIINIPKNIEETDIQNDISTTEYIRENKKNSLSFKNPKRIEKITEYIIEHFDNKTMRNKFYKDKKLADFNSILAVTDIDMAKLYYTEFKKQLQNKPENERLKVAIIYSYTEKEESDDSQWLIKDEDLDNISGLDKNSKDFLEDAIKDYNSMFNTQFDTSSMFQNYYKDISKKVKNKEIDILIVVNMFLTGFDAPMLNTLWVDKYLKLHGLIQTYSRTNRIFNKMKVFGNIVCFRDLRKETDEAITLYGDKDAKNTVLSKTFEEYYNGYGNKEGYKTKVEKLITNFPLKVDIIGEQNKKDFIKLFGSISYLNDILSVFDKFDENKRILKEIDFQNYQSKYKDLYYAFTRRIKIENIDFSDETCKIEFIDNFILNSDYISYKKNIKTNEEKIAIVNANYHEIADILLPFFQNTNTSKEALIELFKTKKQQELDDIIKEEKLNSEKTHNFIENAFKSGFVQKSGTDISDIILFKPNIFGDNNERLIKQEIIIQKLEKYFERFTIFKNFLDINF